MLMKNFFMPFLLAAITLSVFVACNGSSNSPLGNLPDIMADASQQFNEIKEQAKQGKEPGKAMKRGFELTNETMEKALKEGERIKGHTIPSSGGQNTYDFVKIDKVLIDTVTYHNGYNKAYVHIHFMPTPDYNSNIVPKGSKIFFVFLDKDNKKIYSGSAAYNSLLTKIDMGPSSNIKPERWRDLKEVKFITEEQYKNHSY